jgi:hypothetical protein
MQTTLAVQASVTGGATRFEDHNINDVGTFTLEAVLFQVPRQYDPGNVIFVDSSFEFAEQPVRYRLLTQEDLPQEESYQIIQPLEVKVSRRAATEHTAEIEAANLAATGQTFNEAFQNLVYQVLDVFDYLTENAERLGPGPASQLAYLRSRIASTNNRPR